MLSTSQWPEASGLLCEGFAKQVRTQPGASALICGDHVWSYGALGAKAAALSHELQRVGATGRTVAVVMEKGWEQMAAVFGVLGAGSAYVALDPAAEDVHLGRMLQSLRVAAVVTQPGWAERLRAWFPERTLVVEKTNAPKETVFPPWLARRDDAAWWELESENVRVLSNRAGVKMFDELARRCELAEDDLALSVSGLDSYASLPDVFGVLRAGGTLLVPRGREVEDVGQWWDLIQDYDATVLSTTLPTLSKLLAHGLARRVSWSSGRLVLLTTDWIPVHLPSQLRRLASGAKLFVVREDPVASSRTSSLLMEEVDPIWLSPTSGASEGGTPVERPFVVLDDAMRPCPPEVPGHLCLREEATSLAWRRSLLSLRPGFLVRLDSGERIYRTGHVGRTRRSGELEFAAPNELARRSRGPTAVAARPPLRATS